jgi:hypothetical protein
MGADHRRIGRKILDLHDQKVRAGHMIIEETTPKPTGHMIIEETTPKPEAVTQVEAEAEADFSIDLFIACFTRETLIIGQGIVPFS